MLLLICMTLPELKSTKKLQYLLWGILAIGVLLRLAVYLQANSMYVDEANIARNIYERSYAQLALPLNYYQYAPPVFLWIVKACTQLFGYSEYAFRIYPFICSIAVLYLMYKVLKHYTNAPGMWYVLALLAAGPIYVRYAQATKQYIPDMFFALFLIWLALTYPVHKQKPVKLLLIWLIAGTIAICSSMPSVFILAGVGVYYTAGAVRAKQYGKLWFILVAGICWLLQFGLYYMLILKPQANSDYLQNFHKDFFFYPPVNSQVLKQNVNLFFNCIATAGGYHFLALLLHSISIVLAIVYLARRHYDRLLLITVPLLALLFAAALHQFSLIPRVILFAMPLLLILIAVGVGQLLKTRILVIQLTVLVFAFVNIANYNALKNFVQPMQEEEMKESLAYLLQKKVKGTDMYTHYLATPAYVYYTTIHPHQYKYSALLGATGFEWDTNIDSLAQTFPPRVALLYSWDEPHIIAAQQSTIQQYYTLTDSNMVKNGRVYIFEKK